MIAGQYRTAAGSTAEGRELAGGRVRWTIRYDWLEEGGCVDCVVESRPQEEGGELWLAATCDQCGGRTVRLERVTPLTRCFKCRCEFARPCTCTTRPGGRSTNGAPHCPHHCGGVCDGVTT